MGEREDIVAYTDGGCRGNPGAGAWAFVLVHAKTLTTLERARAVPETTNNRMEITAALEALRSIRDSDARVLLLSDSKYLIQSATEWMPGWKAKGWKRKKEPLKNVDLFQALDVELAKHDVRWKWVAGHSGDPGNDRADELANLAMDRLAEGDGAPIERRGKWTRKLPSA